MLAAISTYHVVRGTAITVVTLALVGWLFWRTLKRSEDPARLLFKWVLTAGVIAFIIWKVFPMMDRGGYEAAFGGLPVAAVCGLTLALIWRHTIAGLFAKPFTALYDGGSAEIEPQAYYSAADAKRMKGQYHEAVAELRKQLERFPTDFLGQMKLAEIQAEHLNDVRGAEVTIQRLCNQPGHPPRNIAFALNTLADWHLKYSLDRDAARQELQKIVELFPESEFGLLAKQRIAHLGSTDQLLSVHDRHRFQIPEGAKNIGLMESSAHLQAPAVDPVKQAADFVKHLEQHPQDTEAREKLAVIYAGHYGRLDLATDQLDQLINQPNQPGKQVVHWLNLLADLQIQAGLEYDIVRQTLEEIIHRYPDLAAANVARSRLDRLKLEIKTNHERPGIKLGTYEQNIGLKSGRPAKS